MALDIEAARSIRRGGIAASRCPGLLRQVDVVLQHVAAGHLVPVIWGDAKVLHRRPSQRTHAQCAADRRPADPPGSAAELPIQLINRCKGTVRREQKLSRSHESAECRLPATAV